MTVEITKELQDSEGLGFCQGNVLESPGTLDIYSSLNPLHRMSVHTSIPNLCNHGNNTVLLLLGRVASGELA